MEELIPIIILFVVSSVVSSLKKNQKAADAQRRHAAATVARMQPAQREPVRPAAPAKPYAPPVSVPDAPVQVIKPTVHPHVDPDCKTHDAQGSLDYVSPEGKDPCHEEQLTHARTAEADAPQEAGMTFDWTGDSMVKAIVMQEVLTRPADRLALARRRAR